MGSGSIKAERGDDGRFLAHGYDGCAGGNRAWLWRPPIIAWVAYARASTKPGTVDGAAATSHDREQREGSDPCPSTPSATSLVGRTGKDTLGGIRSTPTYSGTTGAGIASSPASRIWRGHPRLPRAERREAYLGTSTLDFRPATTCGNVEKAAGALKRTPTQCSALRENTMFCPPLARFADCTTSLRVFWPRENSNTTTDLKTSALRHLYFGCPFDGRFYRPGASCGRRPDGLTLFPRRWSAEKPERKDRCGLHVSRAGTPSTNSKVRRSNLLSAPGSTPKGRKSACAASAS
jgi:hypothetical protein